MSPKPLLKWLQTFVDRHGKRRTYVRMPGRKRVPLPGLPGSPEFMESYAAAIENAPRLEVSAKPLKPGTIAADIARYLASLEFASLSERTRTDRRRILERFSTEHGDKRTGKLRAEHVGAIIKAKAAGTPGSARNLLVVLRSFLDFAIGDENPAKKVKAPAHRSSGYPTWTEADIAAFENRWPIGTQERLAFALALFTGQRRSDLVRLGPQHVRSGMLCFTQTKRTRSQRPVELSIPIHVDLQKVLDAVPVENLTFLVSPRGGSFSPGAFTNWFQRRCVKAGVPAGLSPHGLRKATCRRLAEAGCSAPVIAAISGYLTLSEVQRYIDEADRVRMARLGIKALPKSKRG
jgi:integrase